jgi:hypothetical protein
VRLGLDDLRAAAHRAGTERLVVDLVLDHLGHALARAAGHAVDDDVTVLEREPRVVGAPSRAAKPSSSSVSPFSSRMRTVWRSM